METQKRHRVDDIDRAFNAQISDAMKAPPKTHGDRLPLPVASNHPHHWLHTFDGVWVCLKCDEICWLPNNAQEGWDFARILSRYNTYEKALKKMLAGSDVECLIELMEGVI